MQTDTKLRRTQVVNVSKRQQHGAGDHGHERLDDELGVEVDAVERADTARRGVREEDAV